MFFGNFCSGTLCVLFVLSADSSPQMIEDDFPRVYTHTDKFNEPDPNKISKYEESRESPKTLLGIPVGLHGGDPQLILQSPILKREIKSQQLDLDDTLEGIEDKDQQQKKQSADVVNVIHYVVSPDDIQEYDEDSNGKLYLQAEHPMNLTQETPVYLKQSSQRSNPYKIIIIKGGSPQPKQNIFNRRRLLKRLKFPLLRSSQRNSVSDIEQSSEELLHNILESIDQKDTESASPINNAFVTKVTTYNISRLQDVYKNRSFLIEKMVNYSTNLNLLHSENSSTNYSDTHSSVLQTILNLGQYHKETDDEVYDGDYGKNSGDGISENSDNNYKSNLLRIPFDKPDYQSPNEFTDGQYLRLPSKPPIDTSEQIYHRNEKKIYPDLEEAQFRDMSDVKDDYLLRSNDIDKKPLDFVGGQYVGPPLTYGRKSSESSNLGNENSLRDSLSHQSVELEEKPDSTSFEEEGNKGSSNNLFPDQSNELLNNDKTLTKDGDETTTYNPLPETSGLPLTKETNFNKNKPKGDGFVTKDMALQFTDMNGTVGKQNKSPKNSNDRNNIMTGENKEETSDDTKDKINTPPYKTEKPLEAKNKEIQYPSSTPPGTGKSDEIVNPKSIQPANKLYENLGSPQTYYFNRKQSSTEEIKNKDTDTNSDDSSLTSEIPNDLKALSFIESSDAILRSSEITPSSAETETSTKLNFESIQECLDFKNKGSFSSKLSTRNEDDNSLKTERVEALSATTPIEEDLLSSESEDYTDSSKNFLGITPTKHYDNLLLTNPATGKLVTERIDDNSSAYTTQANSLEDDLDSASTIRPDLKDKVSSNQHSDSESDHVGQASDIQEIGLRSGPINTELQNQFSSEEQNSYEQNTTNLIEDVKLYAGTTTASESVFENPTTRHYDTGIYKRPFRIKSIDAIRDNTTELCFPLNKQNYLTLLDLLSGKLYLEKDGKKINLQMGENPLKNCNSATEICKLFFDLKNSNNSLISEEMFEASDDNTVSNGFHSKPKNGKRHITEEYAKFIEPDQKSEKKYIESNINVTHRTEIRNNTITGGNEYVVPLSENRSTNNLSASELSKMEKAGFTGANSTASPLRSTIMGLPVVDRNLETDDQDMQEVSNYESIIHPQTNDKKITLHSLDSPQRYDDKTSRNIYPYHTFGYSSGNRLVRKVHQKRDSNGHTGGACGCNNPLLLSPSPVPDYRHFVGKRLAILTNIVHTVKDWVAQDPLRT